jgi:hypothetical protein
MDPVLAKTIADVGFTIVCAAIVIFILVLLFRTFLLNAATDRKGLFDMLQRQVDSQQCQIAELTREVRKLREDKDRWFHRALEVQERLSHVLVEVVQVGTWCKNGRQGEPPKGPSESDCIIPTVECTETTCAAPAVESIRRRASKT